jgi:hypothetical protein
VDDIRQTYYVTAIADAQIEELWAVEATSPEQAQDLWETEGQFLAERTAPESESNRQFEDAVLATEYTGELQPPGFPVFVELCDQHRALFDREEALPGDDYLDLGDAIDDRRTGYEEAVDMFMSGHTTLQQFTSEILAVYRRYLQDFEEVLDELEKENT